MSYPIIVGNNETHKIVTCLGYLDDLRRRLELFRYKAGRLKKRIKITNRIEITCTGIATGTSGVGIGTTVSGVGSLVGIPLLSIGVLFGTVSIVSNTMNVMYKNELNKIEDKLSKGISAEEKMRLEISVKDRNMDECKVEQIYNDFLGYIKPSAPPPYKT